MIRFRDIANPVIVPESVIVSRRSDILEAIPEWLLTEFKGYLSIVHNSEDAKLKSLLLSCFREIAQPTSYMGLSLGVSTWKLRVELGDCKYVYLPRYNGMNHSTLDYDADGELIGTAAWDVLSPDKRLGEVSLFVNADSIMPASTEFTYTVGLNPEAFPAIVKQMCFMDAGFRREFPLGVDERGAPLVERPPSVELIRDEWAMITDLSYYL